MNAFATQWAIVSGVTSSLQLSIADARTSDLTKWLCLDVEELKAYSFRPRRFKATSGFPAMCRKADLLDNEFIFSPFRPFRTRPPVSVDF